jgi:Tol biopolymer transport system component
MEADGSDSKLLTGDLAGRAYVGHAVASTDGRFIVFTSDLKGERHIWRMNVDGGGLIQLTNGSGEDFAFCSPDSRWVYYTRLERPGVGLPAIGRVSIDGGEIKLLTEDFTAFPAVSPDGKSFACLWAEGPGPNPWRIAIYSTDGGRPIKIFPHPIQSQTIRWTPDGRGLTYSEIPPSGASKLWLQPIDGAAPKQLAAFENDQIFGHDWSRDGKYLACVRGLWTTNVVLVKNFE